MSILERVAEENLEEFLSAADIWLIPYRRDVAGHGEHSELIQKLLRNNS